MKKNRFFRQFHQNNPFIRANFRKFRICTGNFTKKIDFSGQMYEKFRFFPGNFTKKFDFSRQIFEKFRLLGNFTKNSDFPGRNWLFTAISG